MRKLTHMLLAGTLILACSSCGVETTANYQVIPLRGFFLIPKAFVKP